jgi:hypothetical protein
MKPEISSEVLAAIQLRLIRETPSLTRFWILYGAAVFMLLIR